jgi:hypothetical protein
VFIFAAFTFLYYIISSLAAATVCGGPCDHIDLALYSIETIKTGLLGTYTSLYMYQIFIGLFSTFGFYVPLITVPNVFNIWISISPTAGLDPVSNALITIIESIGYLFGLAYGREMLVYFFRDITFPILIPLGLVMRALPFSRKTGSSILAIAFAGFFAYPLTILLSHHMLAVYFSHSELDPMADFSSPTICEPPDGNPSYIEQSNEEMVSQTILEVSDVGDLLSRARNFIGGLIDSVFSGDILAAFGNVIEFIFGFVGAFWKRYNYNLLTPTMAPIVHFAYFFLLGRVTEVAQYAVLVLVCFLFEIIISVTAYRSIAHSLGGELEILGLTKMV